MGMFDKVRCEVPLPDGFVGELQTKDFDCQLSYILIRADGRLLIEECDWEKVPLGERPNPSFPIFGAHRAVNKRWRDLEFHGDFRFYGSHGPDEWHEYLARFTRGALDAIILLPEGWNVSTNVSGAEVRSVSPEIQLASLYADRMIGGVRGRATIGRELDDVIAALPADRRKAVEERVLALIAEERARLSANRTC